MSRSSEHPVAEAVGDIIGTVAADFLAAWLAMLFVGAAHSSDARVPALGYVVVLFLTLAVAAVVGTCVRSAS